MCTCKCCCTCPVVKHLRTQRNKIITLAQRHFVFNISRSSLVSIGYSIVLRTINGLNPEIT